MSELREATWLRVASDREREEFLQRHQLTAEKYRNFMVDGIGRPYWLVTLLEMAPDRARGKASRFARVLRLID